MRTVYIAITIVTSSIAFISMFSKTVSKPKNKKWRAGIFITAGVSPIYAIIQFAAFRDPLTMPYFDPTFWFLGGAAYIFGACLYAIKFPEFLYPGKFDH
jgi:adiponectin receptor